MMRPLAVAGNVNVDLIMGPLTPWPQPGTEVILPHDNLRPGGSAGNVALAWAALGVPFKIAASVGQDVFGTWLRDAFAPHSADWAVDATPTTLSVGLTHPGHERTFLTTRGHLPTMNWPDTQRQLDRMQGGILLLCGSFLTDRLTADYPALFAWAAERGIEIALDAGWPAAGWSAAELGRARGWLAHTRHLLINEIEALALSGASGPKAAAPALAAMMPKGATVVIKVGARGAVALGPQGPAHVAAPVVAVIDTIGAGDIFNAGYLLAVAQGAGLSAALAAGVHLASRAVSTAPRAYELPAPFQGVA